MSRLSVSEVDADPLVERPPPASRHLIHQHGCPLYVWWAAGKLRHIRGKRWRCWFVYLEYRQSNGRSAYRQLELPLSSVDDPQIWQRFSQLDLADACALASRANLIGRD